MSPETRQQLIERILSVTPVDKAKFGKMNVNQMICHCADQFRMMFNEIPGLELQLMDKQELIQKRMNKESIPTVKGLDQAAGEGTKPTDFNNDVQTLISYLDRFDNTGENYNFHFHPFFGEANKAVWERLVIYHLNHHLEQFGR